MNFVLGTLVPYIGPILTSKSVRLKARKTRGLEPDYDLVNEKF